MRILIIGGTAFLGRAYAEEALRRGHDVTTFNRGLTGGDVEGVVTLRGDRADPAALGALDGRTWDVVLDTCGYTPRDVLASATHLQERAGRYVFVSSISASGQWPERLDDDSGAAFDCAPDAGPDDGDYGVLKAGCERAVREGFSDRALVLRPGLILGPHENIGRLPWWLRRIGAGGRVLAPGDPGQPMQLVDARDIAAFTLDAAERGLAGVFNVTAPAGNTTYGDWLADCVAVTGSRAELVWVDDDMLLDHQVEPWTELPLWMPRAQIGHVWEATADRARAEGLRCRPVRETVADTWGWLRDLDAAPSRADRPSHGLDPGKERRIFAAWDARR